MRFDALLRAIADRLNEVVPPGLELVVDGGMLWFGRSGSHAGETYEILRGQRGDHDEVVAAVARRVMDDLQDAVDEATAEPWPGERAVPAAHAVVEEGMLLMWFGERSQPALQCRPIRLDELEEGPGRVPAR